MKTEELLNSGSLLKNKRKLKSEANNLRGTSITIYILILALVEYFRSGEISYNLFSIFFVGELIKAIYKYSKTKESIYLFEAIGCLISIVALIILMI